MRAVIAIAMMSTMAACTTTAGPFVMNMSAARPGVLVIDKCLVELNSFSGTVSNKNCTTQRLHIGDGATSEERDRDRNEQGSERNLGPSPDSSLAADQKLVTRLLPAVRDWRCDEKACYPATAACAGCQPADVAHCLAFRPTDVDATTLRCYPSADLCRGARDGMQGADRLSKCYRVPGNSSSPSGKLDL